MLRVLDGLDAPWIAAAFGGVGVAIGGYLLAWRGIADHPGGPPLSATQRRAIVLAGFGGFVVRGGSALDKRAMVAAGADERTAEVRTAGLDALEHLPLALGCCIGAIFLLLTGRHDPPPLDFVWPWAVAPPIGGALAVVAARHRPSSWRRSRGWRYYAGIALDAVTMLGEMLLRRTGRLAVLGMTAYFAGQIFALWAALRSFGFGTSVPTVILCDAIGYVLTRRSAPLGGAGFIDCFLALCLWDCNVPLAVAIAGVFAYRCLSLFLTMPLSWEALPHVTSIGTNPTTGVGENPALA